MDSNLALFRYCGNKGRLLHLLKPPPKGTKRIVELYLGSGAYTINHNLPGLGYEANPLLCEMWWWLQECTADTLRELNLKVESYKKKESKPDVKAWGLKPGEETYVRVNITGLVVGQLSSWKVYPQHSLPIDSTIRCLSRIKQIKVVNKDCRRYIDKHREKEGDLVFVDPPYVGTTANYKGLKNHEKNYRVESTSQILQAIRSPCIFTYGDGAPILFKQFWWKKITTRKVPNVRLGGSVERSENVAYINWPERK